MSVLWYELGVRLRAHNLLCEDEYERRDVSECVCITIWGVGIAQTIYRFGYPRNIPGVF